MSAAPAARPRRAIVLGGGGVLGFAWMLGALSALESVADFDARDVDVAVGTSAGSVVAALLGCQLPVEVICRHHQGIPAPDDLPIGYDYDAATGGALPPRPGIRPASPRLLLGLRNPRRVSPIVALTGLLPVGRGTLQPVRDLVDAVSEGAGIAGSWPGAPRPWIVAADYRTGQRVVFGRDSFTTRPDRAPRVIRRATLADAVTASCSIPAWYPPTVIDGIPYIDGGAVSPASVDLLHGIALDEVYVFVPMASVEPDRPKTRLERLERVVRRAITKRILLDVSRLRSAGAQVCLVTPGPDDLAVMGVNLMNPDHRNEVLDTARATASAQISRQLLSSVGWGRRGSPSDGTATSGRPA